MKRIILFFICMQSASGMFAQEGNPFAQYGYHFPVITATNGRFQEIHDNEEVVAIGSVLFHTSADTIMGEFIPDTTVMQLEPQTVGICRFLTPDPLAEKYYHISPYAYCNNNPILYVDPDGEDWYRHDETGAVLWMDNNATSVMIDDLEYANIGTSYTMDLADGSTAFYEQNDLVSVYEPDATIGESFKSDADVGNFFGNDFETTVIPERTNEQINKEIKNFALSAIGLGDSDVGPTAPRMVQPSFSPGRVNRNVGAGKGSTKTERKINEKRADVWKEREMELREKLKKATTKSDKEQIKKQIKHAVEKQQKSEPHGVSGQ